MRYINQQGSYLPMYKGRYKVSDYCQLVDKSTYPATQTVGGVTFTNNGDGSWTLNGTSTSQIYWDIINVWIQLNTSHKYLLLGCPKNESNDLFYEAQSRPLQSIWRMKYICADRKREEAGSSGKGRIAK